jgi:ADP-ribose pyrophosphatase YjhB (NUDIX family)
MNVLPASSVQGFALATADKAKWDVDEQTLKKVQTIVSAKITRDDYDNLHINISELPALTEKNTAKAFRHILASTIEQAKDDGLHMVTVKFSPSQSQLPKYVSQQGMAYHFADAAVVMVKKCLKNHTDECTYPKYKTVSMGVTGVVFSSDLTEFVAIQEKKGPYLGPKPITGTVDYEGPETPLMAVVREIEEESNLKVDLERAVFAGHAWTPNFREGKPDINLVFAFCIEKSEQSLKAQESEIRDIRWMPVSTFLDMDLPVKHSKPLLLKKAVEVAQKALITNPQNAVQRLAWGSGKDLEFYTGF